MCERRPDTLGICLSGSPLSLAVFYLEIFSSWTDTKLRETYNGGLNRFPGGLDWLISNLMVYILSGSPVPSARFIFENRNIVLPNIQVPTAVAVYPKNPFPLPGGLPRAFLPRRLKNMVQYTRILFR
ncbi:epoxide hydrolase 1 [Eurytemora carolleeae]|uniref:epoxide hydrolase 1 n=1 Tax=Eurytemora carolleeae TaxID=1294199 RepID=UPI000C7620FE|nr:epoxide hydrolase 1 [Eurytemora carolleeae]|eukprot:XP_023333280.1 epoxide hydrolase 1-like [Eurytemora affinis]